MLKITAKLVGLGGYFFVLLLPIVYPSPNAVNTRLIIAIRLSIVIIRITLFFHISVPCTDLYVNGGSQSLRRGLTAYHLGSSKQILPQCDRNFNWYVISWNIWMAFKYESHMNLTGKNIGLKILYFTGFSAQMSAIRTPYSYNIIVKYLIVF